MLSVGSKVRKDSDSTCTHRTATPPTDDLANRDGEWLSTSTSRNVSPWECSSPSSVGNYYELANKEDNVTCSEGNVLTENVIKSSTSDTLDLFKNKVTASGIKFQDITGLNEGREPALTQSGENLAQSSETSMEMTNLHGPAKSDNVAANLEHAPDTETLDKVDTDLIQFINKNDADVEDTRPEQEMSTEKIESKSNLKKHEEWAFRTEIVKEMRVENSKEGAVNDRGTCATNENSPNTEHISSLKEEDVQIAAFQEIARRKGIKVGNSSYQTCLATSSNAEKVEENIEADCLDILDFTEDVQIAKFQEMAWLNGIKVGGKRLKSRSCSESSESFKGKTLESRSHSESSESFTTGTAQETECLAGAAYPYEEDNQIVRFQEIARLKGIRVTQTGILSNSSSCSSLSLANSDDHLHYSGEESCPVVTPTYTTGDKFEELAKRNGIKIGKSVAPSGSLNVVGPSGDNMLKVQHGSETCSSFKSPERVAVVFCESSTQTEVPTADCFSQTCEKDLGLFKQSTGVQVDAVKEAFEEEFTQWKLDDNAAGDSEELCYRELYFTERNAREALKDSLQNEKDVSAYTKHNHKRVMEQLKEELNSKTEEIEVHECHVPFRERLSYTVHKPKSAWDITESS